MEEEKIMPETDAWEMCFLTTKTLQIRYMQYSSQLRECAQMGSRKGTSNESAREREIVVYWYSFSNPRTMCIHYGFSLVGTDGGVVGKMRGSHRGMVDGCRWWRRNGIQDCQCLSEEERQRQNW